MHEAVEMHDNDLGGDDPFDYLLHGFESFLQPYLSSAVPSLRFLVNATGAGTSGVAFER
jgi:hypothetical protein